MSSASTAQRVEIRRSGERASTQLSWLESKHSFSFGRHYDPANTHHGVLLVNNDDVVRPGAGCETHPHRDMEIVTWVVQGSLVHQDSTGHSGLIYPGLAQRMSAGDRDPALGEERLLEPAWRRRSHRSRALRPDVDHSGRGLLGGPTGIDGAFR